jgi:regulator of nucleoside diphosphate kinase
MKSKPSIVVSSLDQQRLQALLDSLPASAFPGKADLQAELDRADVVEPRDVPPSIVTMNSTVRFAIEPSGEEFCLTLVYPKDATGDADRISVLAPVGSALLGLATGDQMEWPAPGGGLIQVRIVEVVYQPERAGELYR